MIDVQTAGSHFSEKDYEFAHHSWKNIQVIFKLVSDFSTRAYHLFHSTVMRVT